MPNPTNPGKLKLSLLDVAGNRLKETSDVWLQHTTLTSADVRVRVPSGKSALIADLHQAPQGIYRIEVDPASYLPVSQFVVIGSKGTTTLDLTFPVDPKKVRRVEGPAYAGLSEDARRVLEASDGVEAFETLVGGDLYDRLDDIRRAGLLNIIAKTTITRFESNGRSALSYVQKLTKLRGDRFFAIVQQPLRDEAKNAVLTGKFVEAPSLLHHPEAGFTPAGSFKTVDKYGNLQLTFFVRGDEWHADIDIDNASGVEHVFQVLNNAITGRPTHPYDIHELLVHYQKLDPGYALVV